MGRQISEFGGIGFPFENGVGEARSRSSIFSCYMLKRLLGSPPSVIHFAQFTFSPIHRAEH